MIRELTNIEYARSLDYRELPLIVRVCRDYIKRIVGEDAPLFRKEQAYNQWCNEPLNIDIWDKIRAERAGKVVIFR